jgi:hypothetical protein
VKEKTFTVKVQGSDAIAAMDNFFALIHHATHVGHSGVFAVPLDGDGDARVTVDPAPDPETRKRAERVSAAAVDIEQAGMRSFRGKRLKKDAKVWVVDDDSPRGEWRPV